MSVLVSNVVVIVVGVGVGVGVAVVLEIRLGAMSLDRVEDKGRKCTTVNPCTSK